MSVLTIAITQVQDLNGFVNAANEYGNDRVLEMGCKHTQVAKIIMGGEAAGLVGVSFDWFWVALWSAGGYGMRGRGGAIGLALLSPLCGVSGALPEWKKA